MAMFGRNGESPVPIVAPRQPVGLLRRGARGGQDRDQVPHPGDPALRRLPGQRLRAVAHPRRRRPADLSRRVRVRAAAARRWRRATSSSSRSGGTRRRWPGRGPSRARRAWSTGSAASRRPTAPATSPTTRTTTTGWSGCARPRSTGSRADIRRLEVDDPDGNARVLVLGWGSTFGSIGAAVRRVRHGRASASPRRTCGTSTRSRPTWATCSAAYDKVLVPEINLGQLALLLRGRYLVDVDLLQPGPRPALPGGRAGRCHPGCDRPHA